MRVWLALLLLVSVSGCETASLGSPCTEDPDCQRVSVGTAPTATCRNATTPRIPCGVGGGNCVCCSSIVGTNPQGTCVGYPDFDVVTQESAVPDAVDTATDTAPDTALDSASDIASDIVVDTGPPPVCGPLAFPDASFGDAGARCPTGQYCTPAGQCALLGPIGATCSGDVQCQTGFCTSNVCCNSRCMTAGLTCFASSDFAGICMTAPTATDAGNGG